MKRRDFFRSAAGAGLVIGTGLPSLCSRLFASGEKGNLSHVEARYYKKLPDREIECELCPRTCRLGDKERGYCGVRENQGGTYYTLVYGKACSLNVDPIEKKPFFHFLPGTNGPLPGHGGLQRQLQVLPELGDLPGPARTGRKRRPSAGAHPPPKPKISSALPSLTLTPSPSSSTNTCMTRPSRPGGGACRSVVVTAGHIKPEPLKDLIGVVDAIKVDLKGYTQDFYASYVRGELKTVLETIRTVAKSKVWLEIVYLVIPTLNDSAEDIRNMARWVKNEAGDRVPLHFSRFQPLYLVKNLPPTPVPTLEMARDTALAEGLGFVYIGNVPGHPGENTYCLNCKKTVIQRTGFMVDEIRLKGGKCQFCGTPVPGIWA